MKSINYDLVYKPEIDNSSIKFEKPFPLTLWIKIVSFLNKINQTMKSEAMVIFTFDKNGNWEVIVPEQVVQGMSIHSYKVPEEHDSKLSEFFGTVHSHCTASAFASGVDKDDEFNKPGVHLTVGKLNEKIVDVHARTIIVTPPDMEKQIPMNTYDIEFKAERFLMTQAKGIPYKDLHLFNVSNVHPKEWEDKVSKPKTHWVGNNNNYHAFNNQSSLGFDETPTILLSIDLQNMEKGNKAVPTEYAKFLTLMLRMEEHEAKSFYNRLGFSVSENLVSDIKKKPFYDKIMNFYIENTGAFYEDPDTFNEDLLIALDQVMDSNMSHYQCAREMFIDTFEHSPSLIKFIDEKRLWEEWSATVKVSEMKPHYKDKFNRIMNDYKNIFRKENKFVKQLTH